MRQLIWAAVVLCLMVSGCQESQQATSTAKPTAKAITKSGSTATAKSQSARASNDKTIRSGDFLIAEPLRCENLTVFPILSLVAKNDDRFITLEEGLKENLIEVTEVGGRPVRRPTSGGAGGSDPFADDANDARHIAQQSSAAELSDDDPFSGVDGDVNHLMVLNKSEKPLYLMPGEIIVGGKQDRCIAAETIVQPGDKAEPVEVYCVEQGRWHHRGLAEFAGMASAFVEDVDDDSVAELSQQAAMGKFVASAGNLSKKARLSAQAGAGQQRVWEDVGTANSVNGVLSPSDAFTGNYAQKNVQKKLEPYLERLQEPVAAVGRVVGVVVAINGKLEMADVYESTPLFRKLWPKLLKSYALDAAAVADEKEASQTCAANEAKAFLDKAREADVESTQEKGGLVVTSRASGGVKSFSAGMGGMGGGFGGGVHGAAF